MLRCNAAAQRRVRAGRAPTGASAAGLAAGHKPAEQLRRRGSATL